MLTSVTNQLIAQNKDNVFNTISYKHRKAPIQIVYDKQIAEYEDSDMLVTQDSLMVDTIKASEIIDESNDGLQFSLPLKKIAVTSNYGIRVDPINKTHRRHNGLDLKARYEAVYSMMPGKVISQGKSNTAGNYITIDYGLCIVSYCHLTKAFAYKNEKVRAGDIIALSGNTGRSTGPHLHITCRFANKRRYFNPAVLIDFINNYLKKQKRNVIN